MPVEFKDYYAALGVSKDASQDEIRSAFRKLARKYHPDTAEDKATAEERFKEINEAYEVLSDPEKRQKYDTYGSNWEQAGFQPPPGGSHGHRGFDPGEFEGGEFHFGGTGFSDFFEHLFGSRRGTGFSGYYTDFEAAGPAMRGRDVEADILVSLEEALNGSTRRISFRRGESGKVETYTVKIPRGVRENQRIRLAGQGGAGAGGGEAGDLFLRVRFERHPIFEISGSDVLYELELPVHQAVLGTEVEIPTLDGRVRLRIPPGSQNGQKFRLPNRGLPEKGGTRGAFYAVLDVRLPRKAVTGAEKEAWEQIAAIESGAR